MNVGVITADKQNSFSRFDAGMNFRRQHIADEGIAQCDQMNIHRNEKPRKILEWNQTRSVKRHASRAELTFDAIGIRSRCIQPEPQAALRLTKVVRVGTDE